MIGINALLTRSTSTATARNKSMDGNVLNNTIANVQTLCKVCHSYKSHLSNDFKKNRNKQPIVSTPIIIKVRQAVGIREFGD